MSKVLYIITKSNFGGAQRYVFDLATSINKENYECAVALGGNGLLKTKLEDKGIRTISIDALQRDISLMKEIRSFLRIYYIIRKERPDVLHLNSPKAGGLGALAGRLLGVKKIIYTAHGWTFNEKRDWVTTGAIKIFSWFTVILSHKTIVISDKEKRQTRSWLFVQKKIVRIYNGISDINFLERDEARKLLLPNSSDFSGKTWIGTVAELHKNKNIRCAIDALARIENENIIYVIIGEGEKRKKIEDKIAELGLTERVFLVGYKEDASKYLKAFDLFILSSIKEGLPYVLLEAGKAETAVAASDVGGISEIIINDKTGLLFRPDRPKELALCLDTYIQTDRAGIYKAALKKHIDQNFSLEKMISETERLYK